jgi:hypothetical protein
MEEVSGEARRAMSTAAAGIGSTDKHPAAEGGRARTEKTRSSGKAEKVVARQK